ncbi:Ycf66 family protein [Raphidiopsis curvata NIES-932]|nr:Ycf66 family protein [Raphidiopsis curvata NIES-932]
MLVYILSLVVAIASLTIYASAFFFPEIHRKNDFIWSGVGLFYALVLWVFASRITGGLLLGHVASVSLLLWFGWQTLSLRGQLVSKGKLTLVPTAQPEIKGIQQPVPQPVSKISLLEKLQQLPSLMIKPFNDLIVKVQQLVFKNPSVNTKISPSPASTPELSTPELSTPELSTPELSTPELSTPELSTPEPSTPELSTPELSTPELSTPELSTPEPSTPEPSTPEPSTPEPSTPES